MNWKYLDLPFLKKYHYLNRNKFFIYVLHKLAIIFLHSKNTNEEISIVARVCVFETIHILSNISKSKILLLSSFSSWAVCLKGRNVINTTLWLTFNVNFSLKENNYKFLSIFKFRIISIVTLCVLLTIDKSYF